MGESEFRIRSAPRMTISGPDNFARSPVGLSDRQTVRLLDQRARMSSSETILIASDHAGFELKETLEAELKSLGYSVQDLGPSTDASIDYADFAHPLAKPVSDGENRRGVLLCGTGLGMSYTAHRYTHVRAALAWAPELAAH